MAMKMKLNKEQLMDKIWGCWVGKNIGGTLGTPYEGKREIHDITGFASRKGEPLPNDDLDLQLVWLEAMRTVGPKSLDANILADYWMSYMSPHWNEYGIGKSNLEVGLLPPVSGDEFPVKVTFTNHRNDPFFYELDVLLPDGWSAEYGRNCFIRQITPNSDDKATWEMKIKVGENVSTVNKLFITATGEGHVMPVIIPVVLLG